MWYRCEETGKTVFDSMAAGRETIIKFRARCHIGSNGRRRKHRQGKPSLKRVYHCEFCGGYHLTSRKYYDPNKDYCYDLIRYAMNFKGKAFNCEPVRLRSKFEANLRDGDQRTTLYPSGAINNRQVQAYC